MQPRFRIFALTVASVLATAGLAAAQTQTVIIAPSAPPELRVETIPATPSNGMQWQAGHWSWIGAQWAWVPGQFAAPPQQTAIWDPGHWVQQANGGYAWVEGHWRTSGG